ncbi:iron-containing alcohol dehydrogenase [Mucilaginibacter sabulilitoris]|uniref:Iron-containing alcohol dehydrogenase n=1 Tax=Mucilaginibacter sabulilitoris TaxID=1173583 RepID=A0ABZ0TUI0_9SPHI|nr:iron-containing alcohol dehydrogenase [Mucilaginibacter sabulilitoris]WPU96721.1 iron-containing alcohol dehydrogenase [Mucilaginibacter sabulilitoris]
MIRTDNAYRDITIRFPAQIIIGKDSLMKLADEVTAAGYANVLIVTITVLLTKLDPLIQQLKDQNINVQVNTSIVQEPSFQDFAGLINSVTNAPVDVVIGIGGGSVLDVAKLLAAQLDNDQTLNDITGIGLLKKRSIKLICVPTTAGTGSEVSPNAILIDNADNQKKGIISPYLVPDTVILDPSLTFNLPPDITAATGLDALTHCLEAYTNLFAHPFIDMYAYEGMRLIAANLVKAVKTGGDESIRTPLAIGSMLGGFCLGPVNTAGVHALSYPLGSMFHIAHGLSNALLLPYVMEFNIPAAPARYADVARALGCNSGKTDTETANAGVAKIKELIEQCGIPSRLSEAGVNKDTIPVMAADAMKITRLLKNNPRPIGFDDAINIYEAAY